MFVFRPLFDAAAAAGACLVGPDLAAAGGALRGLSSFFFFFLLRSLIRLGSLTLLMEEDESLSACSAAGPTF